MWARFQLLGSEPSCSLGPQLMAPSFLPQEEDVLREASQQEAPIPGGCKLTVQKPSMTNCIPASSVFVTATSVLIPRAWQLYQMWGKLHVP